VATGSEAVGREHARPRRERILDAAAELFRHRGYHAAGIDEIGEAAGISGPGVYRHFPSKRHLLLALFDQTTDQLASSSAAIVGSAAGPEEALRRLVDTHVRFAIDDRSLIAVYLQEERNLPQQEARRNRHHQRQYLDAWVALLRRVRPGLDEDEALAVVQAAIGAIHSVVFYDTGLPRDRQAEVLTAAALRLLLAP
jgi:AcrR family transcriptional regulator